MKDLFTSWDIDCNGSISVGEMQRALAGLCIPIHPPALKRLFNQIGAL